MPSHAEPIERLINQLSKLPGIGRKTAARLAFYILRTPKKEAQELARAVIDNDGARIARAKLDPPSFVKLTFLEPLGPFCATCHRAVAIGASPLRPVRIRQSRFLRPCKWGHQYRQDAGSSQDLVRQSLRRISYRRLLHCRPP